MSEIEPAGYVWAYSKGDYLRVVSPYLGDTHVNLVDAMAFRSDAWHEDTFKYLDMELFALVKVDPIEGTP